MRDDGWEHRTEEEVTDEQQGMAMSDHEHTEPEPDERDVTPDEDAVDVDDEGLGSDAEIVQD